MMIWQWSRYYAREKRPQDFIILSTFFSNQQSHDYQMYYWLVSIRMVWCSLIQPTRYITITICDFYVFLFITLLGNPCHSSFHNDLQLELWIQLFPYDYWKSVTRKSSPLWNHTGKYNKRTILLYKWRKKEFSSINNDCFLFTLGLQNGWSFNFLHLSCTS